MLRLFPLLLFACDNNVLTDDKAHAGTDDTGGVGEVADADGDTFSEDDCDDNDPTVNPDAEEICDGIDNNCDGAVDEGATNIYFADGDGDGFGDITTFEEACEPPEGYVGNNEDCDDGNAEVFPGNTEACNGLDDDCNTLVDDEAVGTQTWYADADGDGFGDPANAIPSCETPVGRVLDATDCDDENTEIHPEAPEYCNLVDDDCDGETDEDSAVDAVIWYTDADADGFGTNASTTVACYQPTSYSAFNTDCNDGDANYHPGAAEADCTDPNDYNCDGSVAFADGDSDGWAACAECDDANAAINPDATEICDGADNDCDGTIDEPDAMDSSTWYADSDTDGYGDAATAQIACDHPAGFVADSTDCDDATAAVNPAELELCNGIDDDCDSDVDEDDAADAATWYADADGDSFGDAAVFSTACTAPPDTVSDATDCNDARSLTHPGATEYCNTEDDDCDGDVDEGAVDALTYWLDADGDTYGDASISQSACSAPAGYVRDDDDCDDTNPAVSPSAIESCNGIDDDCNFLADDGLAVSTWYEDADGDGFGLTATTGCGAPPDAIVNNWDCDDTNAAIYPGSDVSCPWSSCLDLLVDGIASADGDYWIDFDGTSTETTCDMTTDGGGWTLTYAEDFETAADPGWNLSTRYACGGWTTLLGGYRIIARGSLTNTLPTYAITHSEAWIQVDYVKLDSWDGETGSVSLDGVTVWSQAMYYYQGSEVCGWNRGWSGSYDDLHSVSEMTPHSATDVAFAASSTLDQSADDESFGIDDVTLWVR